MFVMSFINSYVAVCRFCAVRCLITICFSLLLSNYRNHIVLLPFYVLFWYIYQVFLLLFLLQPTNTPLTFILLVCTYGRAPNNASKWEMGFNSVPKRLILQPYISQQYFYIYSYEFLHFCHHQGSVHLCLVKLHNSLQLKPLKLQFCIEIY
jgi:hypothetical protein